MKKITILGSTGSIGKKTLEIIRNNREDFQVIALSAYNSHQEIISQALEFNPLYIVIYKEDNAEIIKSKLKNTNIKILFGHDGISEITSLENDIIISAITGFAALKPTLNAIKYSKRIGLANKESIVCAGRYLLDHAKKHNCEIIPIDSEHNSIFQLLDGKKINDNIHKVIITASGGPFFNYPIEKFSEISISEALKHPNWIMGKKITIDSATMVNKALELIEARILFNIEIKKLEVLIHPESIIHALIQYIDGSCKALLACHDMAVPIAHSIYYPKVISQNNYHLDLLDIKNLSFNKVDYQKFPAVKLAYHIMQEGKTLPLIFNCANEVMVNNFLAGKIKFIDIITNIEKILESYDNQELENIEHLFSIEQEIRFKANDLIC